MDVLGLLQDQTAQNRADFAKAQADRAELKATKAQQWQAQGRDANSGSMALSADGDEPRLVGQSITSGKIEQGQAVRVNVTDQLVTVDQKPYKQRQLEVETPTASTQPYWVAFGDGFAISYDSDAKTFSESQYPEYSEYAASEQGDRMFPYGRVLRFVAASDNLWLVCGSIGYNSYAPHTQTTVRLPFAVSVDQGKTWQASEQTAPYSYGVGMTVSSVVFGVGYFFALVNSQLYRSEDGLVWELLSIAPTVQSLAVSDDTVYLFSSEIGYDSTANFAILSKTVAYSYKEDAQGKPGVVLERQFDFDENSQYGAYNAYGSTAHAYFANFLGLESLYAYLLSNSDLSNVPDYGDALYNPDLKTYLSLLHLGTNQVQAKAFADTINGETFLMLSQRWGLVNGLRDQPFGFAAIHEGASWRTCEHPFIGKVNANDLDIVSVTYSAVLQSWLVYARAAWTAISTINGDSWSEPFQPEVSNSDNRTLGGFTEHIKAYQVDGNYVS